MEEQKNTAEDISDISVEVDGLKRLINIINKVNKKLKKGPDNAINYLCRHRFAKGVGDDFQSYGYQAIQKFRKYPQNEENQARLESIPA